MILESIDRYQLRTRLLLVWAAASLVAMLLLKTVVALVFVSVLSYVIRLVWSRTLAGRASHELVKVTR
jgi:hypothetical protein